MIFFCEDLSFDEYVKNPAILDGYQRLIDFYPEIISMTTGARYDLKPLFNKFCGISVPSAEVYRNCICPLITSQSTFPSTFFTEREHFAAYMLLYTVSGKGKLQYHDKTYGLPPGSLFLINCNRYHYYYSDSPGGWEYYVPFLRRQCGFSI